MQFQSPLTNHANIIHEKDIETSYIIDKYYKTLNIDVSPYFQDLDKVSIYKDTETNYRFYYPFTLAGDDKFYEKLQVFDWYYMPWKWEHKQCASLINQGQKILEVGCAKGDFITKLQETKAVRAVGLELNEAAVKIGRGAGLDIRCELVQEHAKHSSNAYDMVCSFQVLEHISEVKSFITANVACARKGGKIVFCVPNNDAFPKYDWKNDILNMPPHHMGLWNKNVFTNIGSLFGIKLLNIYYEPLQHYHVDWYVNVFRKRFVNNKFRRKIYQKLNVESLVKKWAKMNGKLIHGHSIMAIFEKQ